jgi:hypothetical protein
MELELALQWVARLADLESFQQNGKLVLDRKAPEPPRQAPPANPAPGGTPPKNDEF